MDKKKETDNAIRNLKKAIDEGLPQMSKEKLLQSLMLSQLKDTLAEYEKSKAVGDSLLIKKYERKLECFEGLIDKKYWDDFSLLYIILALSCRVADNLQEAITMLENFNKNER